MNLHLLSFIADFVSWSIAGYFMTHIFVKEGRIRSRDKKGFIIKSLLMSLLGGFYGTVVDALPEFGIGAHQLFYALLSVTIYSIIALPRLRHRYTVRFAHFLQQFDLLILKGGGFNGNNR